ncbi:MAG: MATE family efflux transporter [Gemmatimonadales bacterium]|nr:MATE family efflux transporter [Gemmatimonadota bacterium]MCL4215180.1 MATE family efflux transporter [Gemmatimonadales bacterium]
MGTTAAPRKGKPFDRSIVEGPILGAVWKIAWPTVLQNVIGGLQGIVDHAMVGHYVGFTGNAAVGVSFQIFLVVIVFVMSIYTGMGVLVARFAGADDPDAVNRTVYQAFLASVALSILVLAPVGWFLSPKLLALVNATAEVQAEALPYLRTMFLGGFGMMLFFMLGGALRAAGDAQTGLRLGIAMTVLNVTLNVIFIRGLGPIPAFGVMGAALGTVISGVLVSGYAITRLLSGHLVIHWPRGMDKRWDWTIIRQLFRFGLPAGLQGIAMNVGGVFLLRFIGSLEHSAEAQAAYAVGYSELFSFITWTSVGLMGAAAAVAGQNLGAGKPERTEHAVRIASRLGLGIAVTIGLLFLTIPSVLLGLFGMTEPIVLGLGTELLRWLSLSGLFITVALTYTGGLTGTGDTKGPLYISLVSQLVIPLGMLTVLQLTRPLLASDVWLAILLGHMMRATLSVRRFKAGKWREIKVERSAAPA